MFLNVIQQCSIENSTACHVMSPSSSASSTVIGIIIGTTVGLVLCLLLAVAGMYHFNQRKGILQVTVLFRKAPMPES